MQLDPSGTSRLYTNHTPRSRSARQRACSRLARLPRASKVVYRARMLLGRVPAPSPPSFGILSQQMVVEKRGGWALGCKAKLAWAALSCDRHAVHGGQALSGPEQGVSAASHAPRDKPWLTHHRLSFDGTQLPCNSTYIYAYLLGNVVIAGALQWTGWWVVLGCPDENPGDGPIL